MRLVIGALLLAPTSSAFAGGFGFLGTGGVHTERVYFYSDHSPSGDRYTDIDDYDQYRINPIIPQTGGGVEFLLGDRDDRIMGTMRLFYSGEFAQPDPADQQDEVDPEFVVAAVREDMRHLGFGMVGLSWGLVGDPGGFQLTLLTHVGAAFLTFDRSEFFAAQVGPGVTWRVGPQVQLFGDVTYQLRLQKRFQHATYGTLGVRYLFD